MDQQCSRRDAQLSANARRVVICLEHHEQTSLNGMPPQVDRANNFVQAHGVITFEKAAVIRKLQCNDRIIFFADISACLGILET